MKHEILKINSLKGVEKSPINIRDNQYPQKKQDKKTNQLKNMRDQIEDKDISKINQNFNKILNPINEEKEEKKKCIILKQKIKIKMKIYATKEKNMLNLMGKNVHIPNLKRH